MSKPERDGVSDPQSWPPGLRGDLARLFSWQGTHEGKPSLGGALVRTVAPPGPLAILLYRLSQLHDLRRRVAEAAAVPSETSR